MQSMHSSLEVSRCTALPWVVSWAKMNLQMRATVPAWRLNDSYKSCKGSSCTRDEDSTEAIASGPHANTRLRTDITCYSTGSAQVLTTKYRFCVLQL